MRSPFVIGLNPVEEAVLIHRTRGSKTPHREVVRARISLAAGSPSPASPLVWVFTWTRSASGANASLPRGSAGSRTGPGPGAHGSSPAVQVDGIKVLACTPPAETDLPLSRLSISAIRTRAVAEHLVEDISMSTMFSRWLAQDAIKPWQHRSWIFPRDPDFAPKAGHVLDLYARTWEGEPLGPDDYVVSADEKSQLQALHRRHPALPPGPGRAARIEFEYRSGSTLAYFAHLRRASGTGAGQHRGEDRHRAVHAAGSPGDAHRTVCLDPPGFLGRGQRLLPQRGPLRGPQDAAWPTATLVLLPVHASWLNQVEFYFSILQRKTISCAGFPDLNALAHRITAFQEYYNTMAEPFEWRYTRHDLNDYLHRLAGHEPMFAA